APQCLADFNRAGLLDVVDFLEFQNAFALQRIEADLTRDGLWDLFDFLEYLNVFGAGCP
ncbi:MAG: GC-type dockerin domain-anchored protein, partial [Phycisphaerales bacterium JB039]